MDIGRDEPIDYDLKKEADDLDLEGQTSDFEDWWGVEREGKNSQGSSSDHDDDDDDDGGEMMPVWNQPAYEV